MDNKDDTYSNLLVDEGRRRYNRMPQAALKNKTFVFQTLVLKLEQPIIIEWYRSLLLVFCYVVN